MAFTSSLAAVPLQDAQPLKRISSLKTDTSKELSTVEILAQSQQAAKEAAEHQAAEHQAQRPPRPLEAAQAAGLPPAGGALQHYPKTETLVQACSERPLQAGWQPGSSFVPLSHACLRIKYEVPGTLQLQPIRQWRIWPAPKVSACAMQPLIMPRSERAQGVQSCLDV